MHSWNRTVCGRPGQLAGGHSRVGRLLLTLALLSAGGVTGSPAFAQRGPAPVGVSPIVEQDAAAGQQYVGSVMPLRKATIGSAVDGRVVEFLRDSQGRRIEMGERVEEKQPLAQLLTETIEQEIKAAEGELELRKQELAELRNGSRPEEIAQAKAQAEQQKATTEFVRLRYERMRKLFESGRAVTQDEIDESLSLKQRAEEGMRDAEATLELALAGPRTEKIAQAEARVLIQEAEVKKLKDQKRKHTMIARFAGYVVAEHTEIGSWVSRGDPVAEVIDLDTVDIEINVVERHIPHVRTGQEVAVTVPALPDKIFTGHVALIVPRADMRARTFPVKVRVENVITEDRPLLKAGMFAQVTLSVGAKQKSLMVAKDALVLGGPQTMIYVVDTESPGGKTGKARPVPVTLGVAAGTLIQVIGEVQAGQLVVVQGNERLRPGAEVMISRVLKPGESPEARAVKRDTGN